MKKLFEKAFITARQTALEGMIPTRLDLGEIAIGRTADLNDEVSSSTMREVAITIVSGKSSSIAAAKAALAKIKDGTYGICEKCEEPISEKRLVAAPEAALCIKCQEQKDQANGHKAPVWMSSVAQAIHAHGD